MLITNDLKILEKETLKELWENLEEIDITIFGITKKVSKQWLWYLSLINPIIPPDYKECVFDLEFNKTKTNRILPVFKNPHYSKLNPDYRLIPIAPALCVNKEGKILNTLTGYEIDVKWGMYPYINIGGRSYQIHILVALTWIENVDWFNKYFVDHKVIKMIT